MSDYQVTNYGLCGECKYMLFDEKTTLKFCINKNSPMWRYKVLYQDTCPMWEQIERKERTEIE